MHIGECIAIERKKLGISQRELGRRAGVSGQMISKIESCNSNPTVSMIIKISTALDILASELIKDADGYQQLSSEFKDLESKTNDIGTLVFNLVSLINSNEKDCNYDLFKLYSKNKHLKYDLYSCVISTIKQRLYFYNEITKEVE